MKYAVSRIPQATPVCYQVSCTNIVDFCVWRNCVRLLCPVWLVFGLLRKPFVVVVHFNNNVLVNAPHYSVNVAFFF